MTIKIDRIYEGTTEFKLVYCELMRRAKNKETISYPELSRLLNWPMDDNFPGEIGQLLGEISNAEVNAGRPMLSAIAIGRRGHPGDGFFIFAQTLNRPNFPGNAAYGRINYPYYAWWLNEFYDVWQLWTNMNQNEFNKLISSYCLSEG